MGSEGLGECSRETGSGGSGEEAERPLKKARYMWQVKGKYHLREDANGVGKDAKDSHIQSSPETPEENPDQLKENIFASLTYNTGDSDCKDRCCIGAFLATSNELIACDYSSDDEESLKNIDKSISDEIPVTLVKANLKNQDYYLMKWQARQVAKGYLDNTINRVLESWMTAPFDVTDYLEECENDGQVEDEGILMAIQSHGLQSANQSWGESSSLERNDEGNLHPFMQPPTVESARDNYQNMCNERLKSVDEESATCDDNAESESMEAGDHSTFLDAAVLAAIQKKGLTSQSYE